MNTHTQTRTDTQIAQTDDVFFWPSFEPFGSQGPILDSECQLRAHSAVSLACVQWPIATDPTVVL